MPLMRYKAMNEHGKTTVGRVEMVNVTDLETHLKHRGLELINYREVSGSRWGQYVPRRRLGRCDLITFCFHLEQLTCAGVPIVESLTDLRDSTGDSRLREVISGIIEAIKSGGTLSESLASYPGIFDPIFTSLIRTGEVSGQMGTVLGQITENLKWQDEQAAHIRKILLYPLIVGIVLLLVIGFLMIYLVPQLGQFITSTGKELPWYSKALIGTSNILIHHGYLLFLAGLLICFLFFISVKLNVNLVQSIDRFKLKTWMFGPVFKKLLLARFANYFSLMYSSGLSILDCLHVSQSLMGNKAIEEAIQRASQEIADGASISSGFERTDLFPPLVLRMLKVGETTGGLDIALKNVAYFYERDVRESIEKMHSMLGPLLTVVLGGVLLWVILSVLGPMYELIAVIQI